MSHSLTEELLRGQIRRLGGFSALHGLGDHCVCFRRVAVSNNLKLASVPLVIVAEELVEFAQQSRVKIVNLFQV